MMNQKEAVYSAIMNVLAERNVGFDDGMDVKPLMTKDVRAEVSVVLVAGFKAKEIELKAVKTDEELPSYVSGLISNWVNKDTRLNGNTKHVAKNPGSRFGANDPQLKALRTLLATRTSESEKAEIQGYIDARTNELKASQPKTVTINIEDLPADLQAKYAK